MINLIANELKAQEKKQLTQTENAAWMFKSSGQNLLDMNFRVASYRGMNESEIIGDWIKAFADDPELALKWLFFARDVRGGLGERRLFRIIMEHLCRTENRFLKLLKYISEYGRWDDLLTAFNINKAIVVSIIKEQLETDKVNMQNGKSISIMAKWLPSVNTSNKEVRNLGRDLAKELALTERNYRKTLVELRKYLDVTEVKTASNRWGEIDYPKVSSQANIKYKTAFYRHDHDRRAAYLEKVEKGEVSINAGTLFPHDIVHQYNKYTAAVDPAIEALWNNLPNYEIENTLVVADGSGSMCCTLSGTGVLALEVANAIAIYCSEKNSAEFKNKYITFSMNPQYVDFTNCTSLLSKLQLAYKYNEVANTDIYKVFKLILDTAVKNKMKQKDFVKNILIISDMEFDQGAANANESLFTQIAKEYKKAGYQLPRLIFWNVNSRTMAVPVNVNKLGVCLVSGFSVHIVKMVVSGKLDPFEALKDVLMSERYKNITFKEDS
ncbi:MAG: DUF2828 domain-containing protein [Treponema sp.]|nr:DUF2828 domain-containing protein [Treponema sp.]